MSDLHKLLSQRAELEAKIAQIQRDQRANAISQVKALMAETGLTLADISAKAPATKSAKKAATGKVAPKYRSKTGETWTGRGLKPKWMTAAIAGGAKLEDFAI